MKSRDYISDKTVLKRTHSESGSHIIFPQDMLGKRTWEYMDAHLEIPRCRWFSQTYVPLLKDYGEWWVVIVEGPLPIPFTRNRLLAIDGSIETLQRSGHCINFGV